jgi:cobalamin synthase
MESSPFQQAPQDPQWFLGPLGWPEVICGPLFIGLIVSLIVCLLLYQALSRLPERYRQMQPGLVWLLMIPVFNLVWNFFVFLWTSQSYKAYFEDQRQNVGDAGWTLGLVYSILVVVTPIPCLGAVAGIAALVLLIIYLVKINDLKNRIPQQPEPPEQPGAQQ